GLHALRRIDQPVARSGLGEQEPRPCRLGLDLAPKLRDVDVQHVRRVAVAWPPDLLQERAARQQLPSVSGQDAQELELMRREVDRGATAPDLVLLEVDLEVAEDDDRVDGGAGAAE